MSDDKCEECHDAVPEVEERKKYTLKLFGVDYSTIPCAREVFAITFGGTAGGMLIYNLATSRNPFKGRPFKIASLAYWSLFIGSYCVCRYNYRKEVIRARKFQELMGQGYFTEYSRMNPAEKMAADEEWLKTVKRTREKNFRND